VLDTLHVSLDPAESGSPPIINGVAPAGPREQYDLFAAHYERLNYHLEYSGGLLLADGFISELYVHMGFHPAWKYERVIELVFAAGILRAEYDRSVQVADIRKQMASIAGQEPHKGMPSREEIAKFVERAFDRRYRL